MANLIKWELILICCLISDQKWSILALGSRVLHYINRSQQRQSKTDENREICHIPAESLFMMHAPLRSFTISFSAALCEAGMCAVPGDRCVWPNRLFKYSSPHTDSETTEWDHWIECHYVPANCSQRNFPSSQDTAQWRVFTLLFFFYFYFFYRMEKDMHAQHKINTRTECISHHNKFLCTWCNFHRQTEKWKELWLVGQPSHIQEMSLFL